MVAETASSYRSYRRGQIWWVELGKPAGHEAGYVHPAVIVSKQEYTSVAENLGWVIVVPGTSTRIEVPRTARIPLIHLEIGPSNANNLDHTTYFHCEKVRSVSPLRLERLIGVMEVRQLREIENRLCLVMDLFKRG
ncbi:MAG TPA: type II toxin-antitoxin system PemK/MazF family toxin [Candidatus Obscuribacterales bacterium]